jgi:hypothetical protein
LPIYIWFFIGYWILKRSWMSILAPFFVEAAPQQFS